MEHSRETIAMLIDADNSPSDKIDFVLAEMAKYGVVNIRRAYGNWKSHSLKGWEDKLHDYAIRPIQQFDYTKGKNATDMAMTIDAMDLLFSKKLDAFCIVSSDSDFTPLVMRILSEGLNVYGFGQKSTPSPFVNACSTFLYLDSFAGEKEPAKSDSFRRKSSHELRSDGKLRTLLLNAVDSAQEEDGWSNLAKIGKNIANQASFDPRNYGYKRLSDLIRSIDMFDIEFRNNHSELYIRDKRKGRKPEALPAEAPAVAPVSPEIQPLDLAAPQPAAAEDVSTTPVAAEPVAEKLVASEPEPPKPVASEPEQATPTAPEPVKPEVAAAEPVTVVPIADEPEATAPAAPEVPEPATAETPVVKAKPAKRTVSRSSRSRSKSVKAAAKPAPSPEPPAEIPAEPAPEPVAAAEPEPVQPSAEAPAPEKKPRRPARRRPARKKSEAATEE
ncbi:NYN domain-containing protein [Chlorobaculum sp. MV4-Y]|uniref:NYN domain-containing protein n=1 Tax=Chlorobaculum sp. MV4-Y TaxID=2976335 RepID=UPI0021B043AF|nr:NYN domain-containing protein [Chlorobaculum sp. MV4-Y]UWX58049.1 NYN domain-containing protein [Chlorobaculum sp. MV4-Y]